MTKQDRNKSLSPKRWLQAFPNTYATICWNLFLPALLGLLLPFISSKALHLPGIFQLPKLLAVWASYHPPGYYSNKVTLHIFLLSSTVSHGAHQNRDLNQHLQLYNLKMKICYVFGYPNATYFFFSLVK